jgi:hypothetical protein
LLGARWSRTPAHAQATANKPTSGQDASAALPSTPGTASSDDLSRARVLFQRGVELANQRDYTGAANRFREALAIHHAPAVAYNLASALSETAQHAEAYDLVQTVLRDSTTPEPVRARAERLEESLQRLVARLTVIVSSEQADVSIHVDGKPLPPEQVGATRAVAPGDHVVLAERAGVRISERSVRIPAGTAALVDVSLVMTPREAAEAAAEAAPEPALVPASTPGEAVHDDGESRDKRRRRFWIIGAASVVAVAAGVTLAVLLAKPKERTEAPVPGDTMPGVLVWK